MFNVEGEEVLLEKDELVKLKKIRQERKQYKIDKEIEDEKKSKLEKEKEETLAKLQMLRILLSTMLILLKKMRFTFLSKRLSQWVT